MENFKKKLPFVALIATIFLIISGLVTLIVLEINDGSGKRPKRKKVF